MQQVRVSRAAGRRVVVHKQEGHIQSRMAYYLMNIHITPRSIYLTRVSLYMSRFQTYSLNLYINFMIQYCCYIQ